MAYYSNGSEGDAFAVQCTKCKYGSGPCPIALAQMNYNYEQHKDESGTCGRLLNDLVNQDGTCTMWKTFQDLYVFRDPNQLSLF
jgi:hypothetical protein